MPRDKNMDNAPSNAQSKRPPLYHRDSGSQSDTTNTAGAPSHQHRAKPHQKHHHHVGRLSTRVPSTKAFHKHTNAHGPPPKLTRRQTSGVASPSEPQPPPHRRTTSEVKLSRQLSSAQIPKSLSQTTLQRNRSQVEVAKRTRSSDKLKRTSSGTGINRTKKTSKAQVHFDFGSDDPDDEWVDASGSNSPYLSRKGSINSSVQSSLRPSTEEPRLGDPNAPSQMKQLQEAQQQKQEAQGLQAQQQILKQQQEQQQQKKQQQQQQQKLQQLQQQQKLQQLQLQQKQQTQEQKIPEQQQQQQQEQGKQQLQKEQVYDPASPAGKETLQHKEYLTSRLLQRNPSHSAPPMMTADMATGAPVQVARSINSPPTSSSIQEDLISRFVGAPGSGQINQGSFYQKPTHSTSQILNNDSPSSNANTSLDQPRPRLQLEALTPVETDSSVLIPRSDRRTAALPAEASRTQQKLNLQRASSVLEPVHGMSGPRGVVGSSPLIGFGGPGYDGGGNSRDPRIGKLLERTGMEYLVVRRYQNPVARSLNRLGRFPGMEKTRKIQTSAGTVNNVKRGNTVDATARHSRNVSMPDARLSASKSDGTTRASGSGSNPRVDDVGRFNERLSGASLAGVKEEDGIITLLRNLWEKPVEVRASTE
ncbi:hypothetical protein E4U21_002599 [Claviceps maximensis]|nr:hypothetical protein E4U21_002599 [Claviceps maximensis]